MNDLNLTLADFDYQLPKRLIALHPQRGHSRLLIATKSNYLIDSKFDDLINYLNPGDLLVLNDTKVIKARLLGQKKTGAKIELLIERIINNNQLVAHIKANKTITLGWELIFPDGAQMTISAKNDTLFKLDFKHHLNIYAYIEKFGTIPLPPYIKRSVELEDCVNYQTVYAEKLGSVAAPTAGLHFTTDHLLQFAQRGISITKITLHVGAGTFKPVKTENIALHQMHSEFYQINDETIKIINETKARGSKVVAVGTTTLRTLETVANRNMYAESGETNIFIRPGYKFKLADSLITNFHLPKSSLLILVAAFTGFELIKTAYHHAIQQNYKFFSYGDAMLINCNSKY